MIQIKVREFSESDLMVPIHSRRYLVFSPKGLAIDNRQDIESMYTWHVLCINVLDAALPPGLARWLTLITECWLPIRFASKHLSFRLCGVCPQEIHQCPSIHIGGRGSKGSGERIELFTNGREHGPYHNVYCTYDSPVG
jgi:hypothetical protein